MHVSRSYYTPKYQTEELLRSAATIQSKMSLRIPSGKDSTGIRHERLERIICYPRCCILAVVQCSKYLSGVHCSLDGYTTHKTVTAAVEQLRRLLFKRRIAYAVDKLGNVYTLRNERLHYFTNILNQGDHDA